MACHDSTDFRRSMMNLVVDFSFSDRLAPGWKKIILPCVGCRPSGSPKGNANAIRPAPAPPFCRPKRERRRNAGFGRLVDVTAVFGGFALPRCSERVAARMMGDQA
jgi:hypothetical protein